MVSVLGSGKTFLNGATGEGGGSLVGYERRRVGDFQNLPRWATVVCSVRHRLRCYTDVCVRVLLPYIYLFTTKFRVLLCCPVFPTVSRISCNQFALLFFCPSLKIRPVDRLFVALALDNCSSLLDQPPPSSSSSTCGNKAFLVRMI